MTFFQYNWKLQIRNIASKTLDSRYLCPYVVEIWWLYEFLGRVESCWALALPFWREKKSN